MRYYNRQVDKPLQYTFQREIVSGQNKGEGTPKRNPTTVVINAAKSVSKIDFKTVVSEGLP